MRRPDFYTAAAPMAFLKVPGWPAMAGYYAVGRWSGAASAVFALLSRAP